MVRAVFLDWNGTLLDDIDLVYGSICEIFREFRIKPPTKKQYRTEITAQFMDFYWGHGIPQNTDADELNKIRSDFLRVNWNLVSLQKGARSILKTLHEMDVKTAIVSSEIERVLKDRLIQFGINSFDLVIGNAWDKKKALLDAALTLGVVPQKTMYVDDTRDGCISAKEAGMIAVGFIGGYDSRSRIESAKPNYVIERLSQVPGIIKARTRRRNNGQ